MKLTGFSFGSSGADDGFDEATVNSQSVTLPPLTNTKIHAIGAKLTSNLEGLC